MFIGTTYNSIDGKNRMIVPQKYREELGSQFYLTRGMDKCLYIYKEEDWLEKAEKIKKLPEMDRKVRLFKASFFGSAQLCNFDSQGRISIPANLKIFAEINKELITVGSMDKIEIWAKEVYEGDLEGQVLEEALSFDELIKYDI